MNTMLPYAKILNEGLPKNSFFKLYDSHIEVRYKKDIIIYHFDDISNVRFSKQRNFSINLFLGFFAILIYNLSFRFFQANFLLDILLYVATITIIIIAFTIRKYNCVLCINTKYFGFKEIKIGKKEIPDVNYFVSIFKTNNLKPMKQNDLLFANVKSLSQNKQQIVF